MPARPPRIAQDATSPETRVVSPESPSAGRQPSADRRIFGPPLALSGGWAVFLLYGWAFGFVCGWIAHIAVQQ